MLHITNNELQIRKVSLRINFGIYYELRQEILSYGANVEVVYPKTLRAQINEEIAEMHKLYK